MTTEMAAIARSNPRCSLSAETIAGNEDLITEIFLRLPVKSLMRFKCVSRGWLSLISDPHFCRRHTLHFPRDNTTVSGIFFRKSHCPPQFQALSLSNSSSSSSPLRLDLFEEGDNNPGIEIRQSCNGLLLCSSLPKVGSPRNYYVCNPTTKQFLAIPSLAQNVVGMNLAFDPRRSCHYKVIRVRAVAAHHYQIHIYSSTGGGWRLSGSPADSFVAPFDMVFDSGVYCNGAIHWISPTGNALRFEVDEENVVSRMPDLPLSAQGWSARRFRCFGESRGRLYLIDVYGSCGAEFNVFQMESDYSKWFVKYRVDISAVIAAFPEIVRRSHLDAPDLRYYAVVPVFLLEEEGESSSIMLHIPGKLISYNTGDKSIKKVYAFDVHDSCNGTNKDSLQFGWLDAHLFIESLACV